MCIYIYREREMYVLYIYIYIYYVSIHIHIYIYTYITFIWRPNNKFNSPHVCTPRRMPYRRTDTRIGKLKLSCDVFVVNHLYHLVIVFE